MGPGYLNNNSMQNGNQNKSRSVQSSLSDINIQAVCPLINSFGPITNTAISIGILILAMFLFPVIILIVLVSRERKYNIAVILLNIIGIIIFYLIILYCIYLVLSAYFKPVNEVLSNYLGALAICKPQPSS